MGECIGLDFGTTYSVVARLKQDGSVEHIDFGDEENSVPSMESLVVNFQGDDRIGYSAASVMGYPGAEVFKGFKMLLGSSNQKELKLNGYKKRTPEEIAAVFMQGLFDEVKIVSPQCQNIEKAVVGVPYVWTLDGNDTRKDKVADIVQKATRAKLVDFFSEPTLACTYFVHQINESRKLVGNSTSYEGYVFVIDYGGGTLDVTLCDVKEKNGIPYITIVHSWGAGENTDGKIGNAGLAFMEKVAELTLSDAGQKIPTSDDANYQKFVKDIETTIKKQSTSLKRCVRMYEQYFSEDGRHYDSIAGVDGWYNEKQYFVKYSTLIRAYRNSIHDVLQGVLDEAKKYMDNARIPYNDYSGGRFKIATIGGFCKFALTENQIRDETDWLMSHGDRLDTRYTELDECVKPKNRELAIAYGAALVANGLTEIARQCPYTFCCYPEMRNENGKKVPDESNELMFFCEGAEYEIGKPMFLGYMDNGKLTRIDVRGAEIPYIRRKNANGSSKIIRPVEVMELPYITNTWVYIAMALERNERLTMYVYDRDIFDSLPDTEKEKALNSALIGEPHRFPIIDTLLGSLYKQ